MKHKRNVYILYAMALLQGMVFYAPIATLYRQARGISILQITLIESVALALCLLLEIPWGALADRIGYRKTMICCCMLYFVSKIVFWQAAGFGAFLLERVLLSVIIAGLSGVDTSVLFLSCADGESQKVFGIYNGLGTAGMLVAAGVFAVFVGENHDLAGLLTVVSYGIAALLSLGLTEVRANDDTRLCTKTLFALLRETLRDKRFLPYLIGVAFVSETHQTVTVFLNQLQYLRCGMTERAIGYVFLLMTVAGLTGVFSARLTQRLGKRATLATLALCACVACGVLAITRNAFVSVVMVLLLRIAWSLFQPLNLTIQNEHVRTDQRATVLSMYAMLVDSVGVGTNVVFGTLAKISLPGALGFGAALCLVAAILMKHMSKARFLAHNHEK